MPAFAWCNEIALGAADARGKNFAEAVVCTVAVYLRARCCFGGANLAA